uniref:RING-type E3 ubiquitin transferase n=1 Tax=Diabrotica virgifera virgifera TaxID=50390 RepID=A0A6P7FMU2_DIAVI
MDEGTLNDLLECSVCLERLDTSSKVLPCQHTFCKKCLEEIVQTHKELRCPECRVLVLVKVDELPPNVLLMRILEGIKNAGNFLPKKINRPARAPNLLPTAVAHTTPLHTPHSTPDHRINSNKQQLLPHQPYAKAMYDYTSKETGDLNFKRGDVIILKKRIDTNWYQGECGGKQGVFPLSYVQIITPVPSHIPQCKALYDFRMANDEEEGCLSFNKGDIISVIRRVDENWAEGKLNGRIGIFPLAFVELNNLARSLMKLSTNAQPGPSRVAPPTPTSEDTSPLIPTDHTRNVIPQQVQQQPPVPMARAPVPNQQHAPLAASDSSSTLSSGTSGGTSNISSANASSGNTSSSSSSPSPSSPASPPPPKGQQTLPPKNTMSCHDGWYKGTSNRTQKCGVFPGNYVTPARGVPNPQGAKDSAESKLPVSFTRSGKNSSASAQHAASTNPPELPARATSPSSNAFSSSWHGGQQDAQAVPLGRSSSAIMTGGNNAVNKTDKSKERKEKGTVSLMKRLTSMKRSKSPPPSSYSMDNPVFEDTSMQAAKHSATPVHVRSGSCPSQLLQIQPNDHHRIFGSTSQRHKHKERPTILTHSPSITTRNNENPAGSSGSSPDVQRHRKSNSLDAGNKSKTVVQTVRERFRCIAPYPPNSEYELELQVNDIIYVHKKREDGWYKGTQQRTGKTGLFPASFVESY